MAKVPEIKLSKSAVRDAFRKIHEQRFTGLSNAPAILLALSGTSLSKTTTDFPFCTRAKAVSTAGYALPDDKKICLLHYWHG